MTDTKALGEFGLTFVKPLPGRLECFADSHAPNMPWAFTLSMPMALPGFYAKWHIGGMAKKRTQQQENIERGRRLRIARLEAGYENAADAAADLEVDYPLYNNHELGWRGITRKRAKQYAAFFKVNLDWLYENVGPRKGPQPQKAGADTRDLLADLPPKGQQEALDYIAYLHTKYGV